MEALLFGKKTRTFGTNERTFTFIKLDMDTFWDMITYDKISRKPQVVNTLIGISLTDFDKLYAEFELAHHARASALGYTRRHEAKRRRAMGGGRKHRYALRDRLLMTLFWLRAYTTYEVLGFFYDLDKTTVGDNLNDILETMERMTTFHFERPQAQVPKLRSVQEVVDVFPDIQFIMDMKE